MKKYTIHAVDEASGCRLAIPIEAESANDIFQELKNFLADAENWPKADCHWRFAMTDETGSLAGKGFLEIS